MNCRPGDLARIVRDTFPENVGRIVEVTRPADGTAFTEPGFNWWVHCPTPLAVGYWSDELQKVVGPSYFNTEACVLDADLMPIRDPGEDATDESQAWLPPVPSHTTEEITA